MYKFLSIFIFKLLALAMLISLCACTTVAYSPNISQGNLITQELVEKITLGMPKTKVIAILGTPILDTAINPQVIEYVYFIQKKNKSTDYKRITISFENNLVTDIKFIELAPII